MNVFTFITQSTRSIDLANCKYCGEPAGFLRRRHPACEQSFQIGERQIATELAAAAASGAAIEGLPSRVANLARQAKVSEGRLRELIIAGWITAVDKCLEDGVLNAAEELQLLELQGQFELTQAELDKTGDAQKVAKAGVLRDELSGLFEDRVVSAVVERHRYRSRRAGHEAAAN